MQHAFKMHYISRLPKYIKLTYRDSNLEKSNTPHPLFVCNVISDVYWVVLSCHQGKHSCSALERISGLKFLSHVPYQPDIP